MNKYVSIIDKKTVIILLICFGATYFCLKFGLSSNLNITLFSLAVIFPLVFTIREAFKRRDNALSLLSIFKSSLNTFYFCMLNNRNLPPEKLESVGKDLENLSETFFYVLHDNKSNADSVRKLMEDIFHFVDANRDSFSANFAIKVFRILKDAQESMENVFAISMHGTPVALRAYCLVFIYSFPFIFIPTLVEQVSAFSNFIVYIVAATPGFILISLYNIQERMEDPFDQSGLDDIKVDEFNFKVPRAA